MAYVGQLHPHAALTLYRTKVVPHVVHGCEVALDGRPSCLSDHELEDIQHTYLRRTMHLGTRDSQKAPALLRCNRRGSDRTVGQFFRQDTVGEPVYVDGFFPRAMLERSNTEFESRAVAFSVIKFNVSWKFCTFTLSSVSCIECHRAATLQKTHSRQESV